MVQADVMYDGGVDLYPIGNDYTAPLPGPISGVFTPRPIVASPIVSTVPDVLQVLGAASPPGAPITVVPIAPIAPFISSPGGSGDGTGAPPMVDILNSLTTGLSNVISTASTFGQGSVASAISGNPAYSQDPAMVAYATNGYGLGVSSIAGSSSLIPILLIGFLIYKLAK